MYKYYSRPKAKGSSFAAIISIATLAYAGMNTLSPQKTESIDSRVFVEGMTIHLSRNAPPLAALEDAIMNTSYAFEDNIPQTPATLLEAGASSLQNIAEQMIAENAVIHASDIGLFNSARVLSAQSAEKPIEKNINLKDIGVTREELLDALFIPMMTPELRPWKGGSNRGQPGRNHFLATPAMFANTSPPANEGVKNLALTELSRSPAFAQSNSRNQIILNGRIEMSQGLAFTSPKDRIVVYHEQKGQMLESANVRTKEASFEIAVNETSGILVAELRTPAGEVLGLGRANLDQKNILIRLEPTSQGLVGRVIAAGGKEDLVARPLKSAKLMVDMIPHEFSSESGGKFSDPNLVNSSTMILKSQHNGYLNSLSLASAGEENLIPMYSNKMVQELISLQKNSDLVNNPEQEPDKVNDEPSHTIMNLKNQAIIWGRVTKNGAAIAGGQVEILTADQALKPIYFNKMMIPDLSLNTTSSNGYYAFVGVNPGVHALQVTYLSSLAEPSVIPADGNSISQLDIDVAKTKQAELTVFDAFHTEKSIPAMIARLGQSSGLETNANGHAKLHYSEGSGFLVLDVDAGTDFEISRLTLTRTKNTIDAPVVTQSWFEEFRKQAGLDVIAYTGSIIGFIQADRPYKAAFGEKLSDTTKIVYFNAQGELLHSQVGEPGGGFVVFNAPEGLLTVSVVLQNTDKILTQTAYVDRSVVNVFSHWFH